MAPENNSSPAAGATTFVADAVAGKLVLPMIPRVVRSALELVRNPSTSATAIADELAQDPVLSARVLRLANSSMYAGRRQIASIQDAVTTVGLQTLSTLLLAAGVRAAFSDVPGIHLRDFWLHSAVAAGAARSLAERVNLDREAAYLGGLLHESGHLILCSAFPEAAVRAFSQRRTPHGKALADLEAQAFGVSHPAVSALWCQSLQLPDQVTASVAGYLAQGIDVSEAMPVLVRLASTLAGAVGDDETAEEALKRLDRGLLAQIHIDEAALERDFSSQYDRLRMAGESF